MHGVLSEWRPVVDETIESLFPRTIDDAYLTEFFGEATYAYDPAALQRALSDPIWDLLDRGGKRWRAVLFLLFVEAFGDDPDSYLEYAAIPEILHNGTIIVDDVEDGATHRRGDPALHHAFGTDVALNAGNAMYFLPLKIVTRNPGDLPADVRLDAYEMLMYELNRTHLGQGMDIHWHNEAEVSITESEYLEMCACKTGCLGRGRVGRVLEVSARRPRARTRTGGEASGVRGFRRRPGAMIRREQPPATRRGRPSRRSRVPRLPRRSLPDPRRPRSKTPRRRSVHASAVGTPRRTPRHRA